MTAIVDNLGPLLVAFGMDPAAAEALYRHVSSLSSPPTPPPDQRSR